MSDLDCPKKKSPLDDIRRLLINGDYKTSFKRRLEDSLETAIVRLIVIGLLINGDYKTPSKRSL